MVPSFFPMAILRRFLAVEHHYLRLTKSRGARGEAERVKSRMGGNRCGNLRAPAGVVALRAGGCVCECLYACYACELLVCGCGGAPPHHDGVRMVEATGLRALAA